MGDSRTRPYPPPPPPSSHANGPPTSRERAFNDIFNTGRPIPAQSQSYGQSNGSRNGTFTNAGTPPNPGYPDGRNHLPPRQVNYPQPPQQQQQQQQSLSGKRGPPSRQYSLPTETFPPPRNQLPPRQQQQQFDPRIGGQRQVSAPQRQRMYNDISPSHQRSPHDHPSPSNGNDYRTKSLSAYNRPQPPSHRNPPQHHQQQDPYPTNRINT